MLKANQYKFKVMADDDSSTAKKLYVISIVCQMMGKSLSANCPISWTGKSLVFRCCVRIVSR